MHHRFLSKAVLVVRLWSICAFLLVCSHCCTDSEHEGLARETSSGSKAEYITGARACYSDSSVLGGIYVARYVGRGVSCDEAYLSSMMRVSTMG